NWWQNRVDLILKHIFQRGVLSWDPNEEYFQNKSIVNHNGKLYIATTNNDNKVPSSSPSDWKRTGIDFDDLVSASTSQAGMVMLNNTLTSDSTSQALTAKMGKELNTLKVDVSDIQDSLVSNATNKPLSANM